MSNKDNKTVSKMDEKAALRESFNKILPSDDDDNSRDLEKKSKKSEKSEKSSRRLTNSSTHTETGTGSSGSKTEKTKITPPDISGGSGTAYVKTTPEGKLALDSRAVSQQNIALQASVTGLMKERDSHLEEINILKARLESLSNPGGQPVPDPSKVDARTEGPAGAISKDQMEELKDFMADTVKSYLDAQAAAKPKGKEIVHKFSSGLYAPGHSRAKSPPSGLADKKSSGSSHKMGSSLGGDDTDDDADVGTGTDDSADDDDEG